MNNRRHPEIFRQREISPRALNLKGALTVYLHCVCLMVCLGVMTLGQEPEVVQLDGGQNYMCAVVKDGSLYCWGRLDWLGVGGSEGVWQPTHITGLDNVAEVSSGSEFMCVRKKDGTVWCLGDGANGRLGNGSETGSTMPVQVASLSAAVRVEAGVYHACALQQDGNVYCWGKGGELGVKSFANALTPVHLDGLADIVDIAIANAENWASGSSSCVLARGGQISCWGENREGAFGRADVAASRTPIPTLTIPNATNIYGNGQHLCATTTKGEVSCWGANYDGQLGNRRKGETKIAPAVVLGLSTVTALALGNDFTCALEGAGSVSCWGKNHSAQLGRGYRNVVSSDPGNPLEPEAVPDLAGVKLIGIGGATVCALNGDGQTYCWGANNAGNIGNGTADSEEDQLTPTPVRW
jgi:alpha-tubulin suppressor-like RCC1 family protein